MAADYEGLQVVFEADDTKVSTALRAIKKQGKEITSELKNVERALRFNPGNTTLLQQQQRQYQKEIALTRQKLDVLKQALAKSDKANLPDEEFAKLKRQIIETESQLDHYKQKLAEARIQENLSTSSLGKLGSNMESFGTKYESVGRTMQSVGSGLTRTVTPAIVGVAAASVVAATTIDTSLTNVKKTVNGTETQYQQLKQAAVDFSKTNAVSASEILDIQALGAQLGFSIDELQNFGEVVSGLDIATNMDAETAASEMAHFANITKMSHEDINKYASSIVGLGNNFATTEADISAMAMRLAASGTQIGLNEADILGLATSLTSLGVEAEAGGTAVSTIMATIDKDIAMGSEGMDTWAAAARMSTADFAQAWKTAPVEALSAVLSGLDAATTEGSNMSVMLDELGVDSLRQTDVMKRLAGNSELTAEAVALANDEWEKNTALGNEVENRNNSLAAKFEMLKNRVVAIAEEFGGPLADALLAAVDGAEPLIKILADGAKTFSSMSKEEQQAVVQTMAVVAALGPMMSLLGKIPGGSKAAGAAVNAIAKTLAGVSVNAKVATAATGGLSTGAKAAAVGMNVASVAAGALKLAIGGIAVAVLMIAISKIAEIAGGMQEAERRARTLKSANDDMANSLNVINSSADTTKGSLLGYGKSAEQVKERADDLLQSHKNLADSLNDSMSETGASVGALDAYVDVVDELGTKSDLTGAEQARLKDAVDNINEACGTTFKVTDDVNGALWGQVDAIKSVVGAQQERLKYEAASEGLKDLYKEQSNQIVEISQLESDRAALAKKHEGQTRAQWGEDADAYNEMFNALAQERSALEGTTQAIGIYEGYVGELGSTISSSAEEISGFLAQTEGIPDVLADAGTDVDGLAKAMSQLGFSTNDLSGISQENLSALVLAYDGTVQSILHKAQELGIELPESVENALISSSEAVYSQAPNLVEAMAQAKNGCITIFDSLKGETKTIAAGALDEATLAAYEGIPGFEAAIAAAKDGAAVAFDPLTGEFKASTTQAMLEATGAVVAETPGLEASADAAQERASYAFDPIAGTWSRIAAEATNSAAAEIDNGSGAVADSAANAEQAASDEFSQIATDAPESAKEGSEGYARNLNADESTAQSNAQKMANTAMLMNMYAAQAQLWGAHLSHNFAQGILSGHRAVANAATSIAAVVKGTLGHTVPKEGPLKGGEWIYGYHAAVNFSDGLADGKKIVGKAADSVAGSVADSLSDADKEMQEYIDAMIDGYHARVPAMEGASQELAKAMWGSVMPAIMGDGYSVPTTGAVYDSMKILEAEGLSLDQFAKKHEDWAKKLSEDTDEWTDSTKEDYAEWVALNDSLGASIEDMREWESLYKVKDDLISGIGTATDWSSSLSSLFNKTGVTYSKNFVDRIIDGGEDYKDAVAQMADMTSEQVQIMVDQFDDLAFAEKEQELNQRSLYVNSLKNLTMEKPKEWMLGFRETCLDVKEAIYSSDGLSGSFDRTGTSIEGFAADLESLGLTMDDFTGKFDSYVGTVSNGFSQMTKHGKTGLDEWTQNLQLNMAESKLYADNMEKVFGQLGDSVDAEAFRKAVLEGGFGDWGQVMDDLANSSQEEILAAIKLYNASIAEAQESAIEQFKSLAPGEEYLLATIEGMMGKQDDLTESVKNLANAGIEEAEGFYTEFFGVGGDLASGIAAGIDAQVGAIASSAAATVRAAIESAKAEADIHSPSKKTREEVGKMLGQGISLGIDDTSQDVSDSMQMLMQVPLVSIGQSQGTNDTKIEQTFEINVYTQPGQSIDENRLAEVVMKKANEQQSRAMRARGLI